MRETIGNYRNHRRQNLSREYRRPGRNYFSSRLPGLLAGQSYGLHTIFVILPRLIPRSRESRKKKLPDQFQFIAQCRMASPGIFPSNRKCEE